MKRVLSRRELLVAGGGIAAACTVERRRPSASAVAAASASAVLGVEALGPPPWRTYDPFLFCVHHDDAYPAGNEVLGPAASLAGHELGMDFEGRDGWRMYHGGKVPGFPQHPHRGFETVTVARRGYIDHADSMGATARYGAGDTQWLTAGGGIQHAEMFPLLERASPNPLELFQIWLNLPAADKLTRPHFSMLWREKIPVVSARDARGRITRITVTAGAVEGAVPLAAPPSSWASRASSAVAIWTAEMEAGASWTLPAAPEGVNRTLYLFRGGPPSIGSRAVAGASLVRLRAEVPAELVNGDVPASLLLLQGRPIGEPVAQRGPFVMNTQAELQRAFEDYRDTGFGGWPWPSPEPTHVRDSGRFAIHADGRRERAG